MLQKLIKFALKLFWGGTTMRLLFLFQISYRKQITEINHFILSLKLPTAQSWPIQPALQQHRPSVYRHVLQLGAQTRDQFFTIIPMLASCKNQSKCIKKSIWSNLFNKKMYKLYFGNFFKIILLVLFKSYNCYNTVQYTRPYNL